MPSKPSGTPTKVIIDTDFGFMNDDCTASLMAMFSPALEVLGLTIIAGNYDLHQEVANALCTLELVGKTEIPVCAGFDRPLVHERGRYENSSWGGWATFGTCQPPLGMTPEKEADPRHAVDFIIESVNQYPGDVSLIGIGPLTNIAVAIRKEPHLAKLVKEIVIMGGAIAGLPRGEGNLTPTAEFNFWVDPEAARIVMSSGAPLVLCPLNATRLTRFERRFYDRIVAVDSAVSRLFRQTIGPVFEDPALLYERELVLGYGMTDHVAVGATIKRDILQIEDMFVDVDVTHGPSYGTSYGYVIGDPKSAVCEQDTRAWTGVIQEAHPRELACRSGAVHVACEVDTETLANLFIESLTGA